MKKIFIIILVCCTLVTGLRIGTAKVVTQRSAASLTSIDADHYASLQIEASDLLRATAGNGEYEAVQVIVWIVFGLGLVIGCAIAFSGT